LRDTRAEAEQSASVEGPSGPSQKYLQFGKLDGSWPDGVDFPGIGLQPGPLSSRTEREIKGKIDEVGLKLESHT